jgi:hypothetical protein
VVQRSTVGCAMDLYRTPVHVPIRPYLLDSIGFTTVTPSIATDAQSFFYYILKDLAPQQVDISNGDLCFK